MSEGTTTSTVEPERGPSLLINGFLGGVVAVLLAFLPFSPVLGGALAGYLQGPDRRSALRAGALAGLVSLVPLLLIAFLAAGFFFIVPVTPGDPGPGPGLGIGGFLVVLVLAVLAVLGIYTIGGGALGGYVGSYVKEDRLRRVDARTREREREREREAVGGMENERTRESDEAP